MGNGKNGKPIIDVEGLKDIVKTADEAQTNDECVEELRVNFNQVKNLNRKLSSFYKFADELMDQMYHAAEVLDSKLKLLFTREVANKFRDAGEKLANNICSNLEKKGKELSKEMEKSADSLVKKVDETVTKVNGQLEESGNKLVKQIDDKTDEAIEKLDKHLYGVFVPLPLFLGMMVPIFVGVLYIVLMINANVTVWHNPYISRITGWCIFAWAVLIAIIIFFSVKEKSGRR